MLAEQPQLASQGEGAILYSLAKVVRPDHLWLGAHSAVDDFVFLNAGVRTIVGRYVHIASHVSVVGGGELEIGDYAVLATGCRVLTATDTYEDGARMSTQLSEEFRAVRREKVTIGRDAFVGANAVVMPGVTISEGAVVGSGAVVTHDLAAWTVYVGVPARRLRARKRPSVPGP